jgi:hypothetical protein
VGFVEKSIKFLGICILIGCIILSGVLFYNQYAELKQSRYYFSETSDKPPRVFDRVTGKYYWIAGKTYYEADPIRK